MLGWDLLKPFGIDLFCFGKKFLVFNLVGRNLKVKYRRSVLGLLWTLLSPLALVVTFYFVFKVVMKVQMPHYLAFLVSGIIPWSFYSQSVTEGMDSIVSSSGLLTKVPVPMQVFPFVGTVTNFLTLFFALPVILGVSLVTGVPLSLSLLLFPVYFLGLFLICYSAALILGLLHVYFRDLKHLTAILMQLWFYGTPVFYTPEMVPAKYHWILVANPVAGCFIGFHKILAEGVWPSTETWLSTVIWAFASCSAALLVYRLTYKSVPENL